METWRPQLEVFDMDRSRCFIATFVWVYGHHLPLMSSDYICRVALYNNGIQEDGNSCLDVFAMPLEVLYDGRIVNRMIFVERNFNFVKSSSWHRRKPNMGRRTTRERFS